VASDNTTAQSLVGIYAGAAAGGTVLLVVIITATIIAIYMYKNLDHSGMRFLLVIFRLLLSYCINVD
jgi:hypothetical protein